MINWLKKMFKSELPPPPEEYFKLGNQIPAGLGVSTVIADFDFETYSPAGHIWNPLKNRWEPPHGASECGLPSVGAAVYTEDPGAEVICLAYDLKDGRGKRQWCPGNMLSENVKSYTNPRVFFTAEKPPPYDLFDYLACSGLIEAWNVSFEYWVWTNICVPKYGFPPLPVNQLRCAMAKARAFALPGKLDNAGKVLNTKNKKDPEGKRLITKFTKPRNPTVKNPATRITAADDPKDMDLFYQYNVQDIVAEAEISGLIPDLSPSELEFWQCDQAINRRGVQIDLEHAKAAIKIIEQAYAKYNKDLQRITNNEVTSATEVAKILKWSYLQGVTLKSLDAEAIAEALEDITLPTNVREVLSIREMLSSAAVKKLYTMVNQATKQGRLHDLFIYHSARTGRAAGAGLQPQNFPNSGPDVLECQKCFCFSGEIHEDDTCPWCGTPNYIGLYKVLEWNHEAVEDGLKTIKPGVLELMDFYWDNPLAVISGCLRGLIIAAPGKDLICSDYKAIEAVVLAALAGEEWRMEIFKTHGEIYEMSASKIIGVPFDEFRKHRLDTGGELQPDGAIRGGQHHPKRKLGKVAELASGYQGWTGAWKAFKADKFLDEEEIKKAVLAWRKASPRIVEMWGGQQRNWNPELYGLEGMAILAIQNPGHEFNYRGIVYLVKGDVLYCRLLSGRYLVYHKPRLMPGQRSPLSISFEGWNTNPKNGPIGWIRMNTYGGKLTENVVQATARDILAHAIVNLEKSGYPVVLHVHDEIVSEVPEGTGSVEEFEKIMSSMPSWAKDWPIVAKGGWRSKRYRKD